MPDNTYTAKTRLLAPVPRSKRMRDANVTVAQQQSAQQPTAEQTWTRDTASVQGVEVLVPVAEPLVEVLRLRNGSHIVTINVDSNGYLHVDSGMYSDSFVSALGLNPDAPTPGGGGLDEDELWTILGGSSTNHHILPTYLDSVPWASLTGKPGWIGSSKPSYTKSEVGLGNVDNTADANKSVYGVIDYGGSNTIRIGYSGSGLTSSNLTHIAGYTDNGTKIKDVSKSVLKEWLNYTTTDIGALPLSGGTMTGSLKIATGLGISDATGNGMLVYKPTSWTGVSSSQWSVGATDCPGVIRTSGNNLYHYKNDTQTSQLILDSSNFSSYALPLSGGTMTGVLTLKANQYSGANGYGMNCNNSDLFNVNSIITADNAESFGEGILFWRSATPTYDCLTASGGTFYFGANKAYNAALSGDADISCGSIYSHNYIFLNANNSGIYFNSTGIAWHNSSNIFTASCLTFDSNGYTHLSNHLMLDGAASSSIANTTQLVFRASSTQQVALTSNANALIINPTTSSPTGQVILGVNGHYTAFLSSGNVGIGTSSPTSKLHVVGNIYATGDITAGANSSDRRLKKDIKQFNAMSIVDALRPIQFRWNNVAKGLDQYFDTDEIQYGLIAQECDKAMPGLAFKFKANDYYGVRYEKLIPILLQAVKELQDEINKLKK